MRAAFLGFLLLLTIGSLRVSSGQPAQHATTAAHISDAAAAKTNEGLKLAAEDLLARLKEGREDVQRQALLNGRINAILKILLIMLASIVAFDKNFSGTKARFLVGWIPLLSLLLAIGTGVDIFLKLGQRATGSYNYVSNVEDLELRANRVLRGGSITAKDLQEIEERYTAVKEQHRRELSY